MKESFEFPVQMRSDRDIEVTRCELKARYGAMTSNARDTDLGRLIRAQIRNCSRELQSRTSIEGLLN